MKEHDTAKLDPAEGKQWGDWVQDCRKGKEARAQLEFTSATSELQLGSPEICPLLSQTGYEGETQPVDTSRRFN